MSEATTTPTIDLSPEAGAELIWKNFLDARLEYLGKLEIAQVRAKILAEVIALDDVRNTLLTHRSHFEQGEVFTIGDSHEPPFMSMRVFEHAFDCLAYYSRNITSLDVGVTVKNGDTCKTLIADVAQAMGQSRSLTNLSLVVNTEPFRVKGLRITKLLGANTNVVSLKLALAPAYFLPNQQMPHLEHLELVSSLMRAKGPEWIKTRERLSEGPTWKALLESLDADKFPALKTLRLHGILPKTSSQDPLNRYARLPKLAQLDVYDQLEACDFFCRHLSSPGPPLTFPDFTLRIALFPPEDQARIAFIRLFDYIMAKLVKIKDTDARLAGLEINWQWDPSSGSSCPRSINIALQLEGESKPSSELRRGAVSFTLETVGPIAWISPKIGKRLPLESLRSLSLGGPGEPKSIIGMFPKDFQDICIRASSVEELTLRNTETCRRMCTALWEQTEIARDATNPDPAEVAVAGDGGMDPLQSPTHYAGARADRESLQSKGTATSPSVSNPERALFPKMLLVMKRLILVDVDFTFILDMKPPAEAGCSDGAVLDNRSRVDDGRTLHLAQLLHELLSIRQRRLIDQPEAPIVITISGCATKITAVQLDMLKNIANVHVDEDVPGRSKFLIRLAKEKEKEKRTMSGEESEEEGVRDIGANERKGGEGATEDQEDGEAEDIEKGGKEEKDVGDFGEGEVSSGSKESSDEEDGDGDDGTDDEKREAEDRASGVTQGSC